MQLLSLGIRLIVLCVLLWLAVIDVRSRRLPTRIVLVIGALFFADALARRMPLDDVIVHLLLAIGVFLFCAVLFAAKMLGGGDAKLASVIFLWAGLALSLPALTLISVIGTVVSLISLATRAMNPVQRFMPMRALAMFSGARGVPYGVALALGGGIVIVLPALMPFIAIR
ncbi:peptidase A24A prepilin type IV [Burkholderia sp. KK1]|uniref:A24 family peptidase n=1 Tax=unclassified Caballeronia TaxID=2646786 RepID=UPI000979A7CA|nr:MULTISPECIES: prepilin peptidase [unclassified Caballeronia]AQH01944.1 peptidase A24A prepilin type IV [Burkholderia sp. KK1]MCE4544108.1 prepilin peptidase [Caballeronia sp. PC1]MCE4571259.1 prepilin peptidase [Caballeronia sp. CLC5]BBP98825.1 fimbriae assembly protein [Burkholderia sp. SFA1]